METDEIVRIDEDSLDAEWVEQPSLVLKYTEAVADERFAYTQVQNKLALVEAQMTLKVRSDPGKFGLTEARPPMDLVKAAVISSTEYQRALLAVLKAKLDLDSAAAAVTALDHKKKALENLVDLHATDYYSSPRQPRASADRERIQQSAKRATRKGVPKGVK